MKLVSIVSARPNFVKLAAIVHALKKGRPDAQHIIIHTGQHYDPLLSDVFFRELEIPEPDENFGVKSGRSNEETVECTKEATVPVLKRLKPDRVLVYGDVSGALGGAKAAHALGIPVAHIEAGLRSFDSSMPEEFNRREIDTISDLLFVTEQSGVDNLQKEGITQGVHFVGNTMIDTLMRKRSAIENLALPENDEFRFPFGMVTLHRPSNVDTKGALQTNINFFREVAEHCPLALVLHPRTMDALNRFDILQGGEGSPKSSMMVYQPYGYLLFLKRVLQSQFVITDSGGLQEETTFLKKKCFTLRKNTERPCTLEENGGSNTLIDLEKPEDRAKVLAYAETPKPVHVSLPDEWDGRAGERIIGILKTFLA